MDSLQDFQLQQAISAMIGQAFAISLIFNLACLYFCSQTAKQKGHSGGWAALGGLCFGLLALIYYAGLPDRKLQQHAEQQAKALDWLARNQPGQQ